MCVNVICWEIHRAFICFECLVSEKYILKSGIGPQQFVNFTCNGFEITHLQYSLKLSIVNGVRMVATDMESWCRDASSSSAPAMYVLVGASTSSRLNNRMNKQTNK